MTGREVRLLRDRLGLTQADFAERVGVTRNSVARWERGEMAIRESAVRLMRLLATPETTARRSAPRTGKA
jgi:DNA-binding transcriptional regulator YiaG